jgi:hypothetical protein
MELNFTEKRIAGIKAAKAHNAAYAEGTDEEYVQFVMDGASDSYCHQYSLSVEEPPVKVVEEPTGEEPL